MYSTASQGTVGKTGLVHLLPKSKEHHLTYRLGDFDSDTDADLLALWYNDGRIRHLAFQHKSSDSYEFIATRHSIRKKMLGMKCPNFRMYFIECDGISIGQFSIQIQATPLQKHKEISAWVGLLIGDIRFRGEGLGKEIVIEIERRALEMGACRIELGVYQFNKQALGLYETMGYVEFTIVPKQTWWNGCYWSSIHMEKWLVAQ